MKNQTAYLSAVVMMSLIFAVDRLLTVEKNYFNCCRSDIKTELVYLFHQKPSKKRYLPDLGVPLGCTDFLASGYAGSL